MLLHQPLQSLLCLPESTETAINRPNIGSAILRMNSAVGEASSAQIKESFVTAAEIPAPSTLLCGACFTSNRQTVRLLLNVEHVDCRGSFRGSPEMVEGVGMLDGDVILRYGVERQVPVWVITKSHDITAKTDEHDVTKNEMRLMVCALLIERFKFALHTEMQQVLVLPGS